MGKSKIEWTDRVWNPVTGCSKISPGCDNCYAERMSKRFAETWGLPANDYFKVTLHPERLLDPMRWKKPSKIFVCSMADLFHEDVNPLFFFDVIRTMDSANWHTYIILTKRPERMKKFLSGLVLPRNIWIGVTAENQEQADKRIPILLQIPAAVRFVSVEPMLSEVNLSFNIQFEHEDNEGYGVEALKGIDWVICGGESGQGARPMHPDWARSLRDQCIEANVPFFFKQWGEYIPHIPKNDTEPLMTAYNCVGVRGHKAVTMPDGLVMELVGKKNSGSLLDGQAWKQYPEVNP